VEPVTVDGDPHRAGVAEDDVETVSPEGQALVTVNDPLGEQAAVHRRDAQVARPGGVDDPQCGRSSVMSRSAMPLAACRVVVSISMWPCLAECKNAGGRTRRSGCHSRRPVGVGRPSGRAAIGNRVESDGRDGKNRHRRPGRECDPRGCQPFSMQRVMAMPRMRHPAMTSGHPPMIARPGRETWITRRGHAELSEVAAQPP
jgi:hypothetical protein